MSPTKAQISEKIDAFGEKIIQNLTHLWQFKNHFTERQRILSNHQLYDNKYANFIGKKTLNRFQKELSILQKSEAELRTTRDPKMIDHD